MAYWQASIIIFMCAKHIGFNLFFLVWLFQRDIPAQSTSTVNMAGAYDHLTDEEELHKMVRTPWTGGGGGGVYRKYIRRKNERQ